MQGIASRSNIALIGFRGTGKSSIGRILAQELHWTFIDMDRDLVASFGQDIKAWVSSHGWEAFREAESRLLEAISEGSEQVLATGGGVVLRPPNRKLLQDHFFVVWLQASADTIEHRLQGDPSTGSFRPALTSLARREEIELMLSERSPLYQEAADLIVPTDGVDPFDLSASIVRQLPWPEPH